MLMNTMLMLALLSIGLFAGLMMTLVVVMQAHWSTLKKEEYVPSFKGFLQVAKGNATITVLTLASFLLPWVLGTIQLLSGNTLPGALALLAGVVFFLGCFGVTMRLNFPIYNQVMGWQEAAAVTGWEEVSRRFYGLNVIRMTSAIVSFLLLGIGILV